MHRSKIVTTAVLASTLGACVEVRELTLPEELDTSEIETLFMLFQQQSQVPQNLVFPARIENGVVRARSPALSPNFNWTIHAYAYACPLDDLVPDALPFENAGAGGRQFVAREHVWKGGVNAGEPATWTLVEENGMLTEAANMVQPPKLGIGRGAECDRFMVKMPPVKSSTTGGYGAIVLPLESRTAAIYTRPYDNVAGAHLVPAGALPISIPDGTVAGIVDGGGGLYALKFDGELLRLREGEAPERRAAPHARWGGIDAALTITPGGKFYAYLPNLTINVLEGGAWNPIGHERLASTPTRQPVFPFADIVAMSDERIVAFAHELDDVGVPVTTLFQIDGTDLHETFVDLESCGTEVTALALRGDGKLIVGRCNGSISIADALVVDDMPAPDLASLDPDPLSESRVTALAAMPGEDEASSFLVGYEDGSAYVYSQVSSTFCPIDLGDDASQILKLTPLSNELFVAVAVSRDEPAIQEAFFIERERLQVKCP